jgi:hypothetical protein
MSDSGPAGGNKRQLFVGIRDGPRTDFVAGVIGLTREHQ